MESVIAVQESYKELDTCESAPTTFSTQNAMPPAYADALNDRRLSRSEPQYRKGTDNHFQLQIYGNAAPDGFPLATCDNSCGYSLLITFLEQQSLCQCTISYMSGPRRIIETKATVREGARD